jgi:hypothetical protein
MKCDCHCLAAIRRLTIVQDHRWRPSSAFYLDGTYFFGSRALLGRLAGFGLQAKSSQAAKQWQ